jgi:hypothetical protein
MRTLLIAVASLGATACTDSETEQRADLVWDAKRSCREAKDQAEYIAGLRKSLDQRPYVPADIEQAVDEACAANEALIDASS